MKRKPITNKHFAAIFFAGFVLFFFIFVFNRYTLNIIFSFIFLQLAIGFKTWEIIREVQNDR